MVHCWYTQNSLERSYVFILFHSAGVGRTGTFITIDHVLEQVEKEGVVDIAGVINKIRTQRMKLVQTVVGLPLHPVLSVFCGVSLWC